MRVLVPVILAAVLVGLAYHAWPAGRTDQEIPLSATETARQAKTPCTRQRVLILAQRLPNGKSIPVMVAVVTMPC